jgi:ankyrin repeat protein
VGLLKYLVDQNPQFLSSHDQDGSLPLHVACRRGASFSIVQSLVNRYKASVKSVNSQGDLAAFPGMRDTRNASGHYLPLDEVVPRSGLPIKSRELMRG